ncbi:hypothetical protein Tco_1405186 [Tanacetum coccineum]
MASDAVAGLAVFLWVLFGASGLLALLGDIGGWVSHRNKSSGDALEDPAQGEKSQWDAFAERNRDAAATKVLTWEADLDLKRSVTIIQKEKDRTKEGGATARGWDSDLQEW